MFSAFSTSFQPKNILPVVVSNEPFQVPQDTVGIFGSVNPYYIMNHSANYYVGTSVSNKRDNSYPIRNKSGNSYLEIDLDDDFLHGSTIYHCSRHVLTNNDQACYFLYTNTSSDDKTLSCLMLTRYDNSTNEITLVVSSRGVSYLEENLTNLTNVKTEYMHSFISIFTLSSGQKRLTLKFFNEDKSLAYHKELNVPNDFSTDFNWKNLSGTNFLLGGSPQAGRQGETKNCLYWDGKVLRNSEMATIVDNNT